MADKEVGTTVPAAKKAAASAPVEVPVATTSVVGNSTLGGEETMPPNPPPMDAIPTQPDPFGAVVQPAPPPPIFKRNAAEEVWESTTTGWTTMMVVNDRGREVRRKVGGRIGDRLRIQTIDREAIQERVRDETQDPFKNGRLIRVDQDQNLDDATRTTSALTEPQLIALLGMPLDDFVVTIMEFSELALRRMSDTVRSHPSAPRGHITAVQDLLTQKYPIGGTTPTYEELRKANETAAAGVVGR